MTIELGFRITETYQGTLLYYGINFVCTLMTLNLDQILENLIGIAKEDGKVTNEEEQFLATLQKDIELFQNSVNYATQDDYISEDQLHDLIILRDKILTDALQFNTQSEDVNKLVNGLYTEINDFMIPGMDSDDMPES